MHLMTCSIWRVRFRSGNLNLANELRGRLEFKMNKYVLLRYHQKCKKKLKISTPRIVGTATSNARCKAVQASVCNVVMNGHRDSLHHRIVTSMKN